MNDLRQNQTDCVRLSKTQSENEHSHHQQNDAHKHTKKKEDEIYIPRRGTFHSDEAARVAVNRVLVRI